QVEVGLLGETQRVFDAHDADLLAGRSDQADLADADPLVDTGLADVELLVCRTGAPHARERPSHAARVRAEGSEPMRERVGRRSSVDFLDTVRPEPRTRTL